MVHRAWSNSRNKAISKADQPNMRRREAYNRKEREREGCTVGYQADEGVGYVGQRSADMEDDVDEDRRVSQSGGAISISDNEYKVDKMTSMPCQYNAAQGSTQMETQQARR